MKATGKTVSTVWNGKPFVIFNQRCREWNTPYEWEGNGETLSSAGCGIFSLAHAAQYLDGEAVDPIELASYSCRAGGRGDDGTDRPALLAAMERDGLAARYGFFYERDGLRNDLETLFDHLLQGGTALCNLRVGHIVALIGAREKDGEKQVLAADPYSESADPRVRDAVRECIPGSEIVFPVLNQGGAFCGMGQSFALFWCALSTVRDFNLLHRCPRKGEKQ